MDSDKTSGQIPKSVECHLKNDLVESVTPGDVIDVTAVVSVILDPDPRAKGANNHFKIYLEAISIQRGFQNQTDKTQIDFTLLDLKAVQEIFSYGEEILKLLGKI